MSLQDVHQSEWYQALAADRHDSDSMLEIKAKLPAEVGQMFIKAIEAACDEIPVAETSAETSNGKFQPQPSAGKADALAMIAESFLAQGAALYRTLKSRDRGCCRFPGCINTRYLDGHHV